MVWTTQAELAEARKRPQSTEGTLYGALKTIMDEVDTDQQTNKDLLGALVQRNSLSAEVAEQHLELIAKFGKVNSAIADSGYTILLLVLSLPQTYAYIDGAKLLVKTRRLAERQYVEDRLRETDDIMDRVRNGFADGPGGFGLSVAYEALGQRHARLAESPESNPEEAPEHPYINQIGLAYTLLTFSYSPLVKMQAIADAEAKNRAEATKPILEDDELRNWIGVWKLIGSAMGIEEGGLPDSFDEAEQLWDLIVKSPGYGRSDEGVTLLQALKEHVLERFGSEAKLFETLGDEKVLKLLYPS